MKKVNLAVFSIVIGFGLGVITSSKIQNRLLDKKNAKVEKFRTYYTILNQWLILKQEGKSIETFFKDNHYKTVAIYGMGEMGERLYHDLIYTSVHIKYAIDKNLTGTYKDLAIQNINTDLPFVDVIVVTSTFDFDIIKQLLAPKIDTSILSIEDIVFGI